MKFLISKPVFIFISYLLFVSAAARAQNNNASYETITKNSSDSWSSSLPSFTTSIEPQSDSSFRIMIDNPQKKLLSIRITHPIAGIVIDTTTDSAKFACLYNLGNADDGLYRVVVRNGKEKFRKNVQVNTVTTVSRSLQIE